MLYPKANEFRDLIDLSGFFSFKLDPDKIGKRQNWQGGVKGCHLIAIPASWNEQFLDTKNYLDNVLIPYP